MNKGLATLAAMNKGLATLAAAIPCSVLLQITNGQHGIGWFMLAMLLIW